MVLKEQHEDILDNLRKRFVGKYFKFESVEQNDYSISENENKIYANIKSLGCQYSVLEATPIIYIMTDKFLHYSRYGECWKYNDKCTHKLNVVLSIDNLDNEIETKLTEISENDFKKLVKKLTKNK